MATVGLNISGGEFGGSGGTHNSTYHYPTFAELKFYADKGVDLIRLPIKWERVQDALDGPLDLAGDIAMIKKVLTEAASLGMDVIIDVHNYGRYKGVAIGAAGGPTPAQFADFWKKMALEFKDMPALVGYDLMNEPHDMPTWTIWKEAAQAATNAIREVDMDNTIIIEGNAWSGAHSWLKYNSTLIINDPANKIVYQAHQYFDDDNSGTYGETYEGEAADPMIGVRRLEPFVQWLEANNLKGMIGETGVPSNDPRWIEVMKNSLDYMMAHDLDVTAWAGGAWWGEGYSMYVGKPGSEDSAFGDLLEQYFNTFDGFETRGPSPSLKTPIVKIGDSAVNENAGTMTFTVVRSGDLSGTSVINYSTAKGTATSGTDFVAKTGTLTFAPGETTKTITVAITADTLAEANETLKVNLTVGSNARIHDALGVGTIREAVDTNVPAVSINDVTVDESAGTMTFTVSRSGSLTNPSSVSFATSNGSASAGSDYNGLTGTVSFAAGETSKTITVAIINDSTVELAETINVTLTGATNATITDSLGVGTIATSDVGPGVIVGTNATETMNGTSGDDAIYAFDGHDTVMGSLGADFIEGGAGGDQVNYVGSNASVNVDLTRAVQQGGHAEGDQLVSVLHVAGSNYADTLTGNSGANDLNGNGGRDTLTGGAGADRFVFDSAAEANGDVITDYTAEDRLSFTSGVPSTTSFWLSNDGVNTTLSGDTNGDGVRDFAITVNGVHTALNGVTLTTPPPPPPPAPEVAVSDVLVNEADGTATFTVTRSGDLTNPSTVNYATENGSATAGTDYSAQAGTVSFAAGQATATIVVAIINDTEVETNEAFSVALSGGTNVVIKDGVGIGTIVSEDVPPPPPTVSVNDVSASETDGSLTFTLVRSGDLSGTSTVDFATANGTALAGLDYTATAGTISFAPGQATATISVAVINDTLVENAETLSLQVTGGTNLTIGDGIGVATLTSEDVAVPPPSPTNSIVGTNASETITGTAGDDVIDAMGGNDVVIGGGGADRLTGGTGSDRFVFEGAADANGDVVTDFAVGVDKLDLTPIDADIFQNGNQDFTWLDTGAFTGRAGQLREYMQDNRHYLAGDTNGDGKADFIVEVAGTTDLGSADLLGLVKSAGGRTTKTMGYKVGAIEAPELTSLETAKVDVSSDASTATVGTLPFPSAGVSTGLTIDGRAPAVSNASAWSIAGANKLDGGSFDGLASSSGARNFSSADGDGWNSQVGQLHAAHHGHHGAADPFAAHDAAAHWVFAASANLHSADILL